MKVKVIDNKTGRERVMAPRYAAILTAIGRSSYAPAESAKPNDAAPPQSLNSVTEVTASVSPGPDPSMSRDENVAASNEVPAVPAKARVKRKYERRDMKARD